MGFLKVIAGLLILAAILAVAFSGFSLFIFSLPLIGLSPPIGIAALIVVITITAILLCVLFWIASKINFDWSSSSTFRYTNNSRDYDNVDYGAGFARLDAQARSWGYKDYDEASRDNFRKKEWWQ